MLVYTRIIWKANSGDLLTKQAMRKKYTNNTYILKLLIDVDAAGIEALLHREISFCVPVSKNSASCELSCLLTPSMNFS
jgi:hypothetical protein